MFQIEPYTGVLTFTNAEISFKGIVLGKIAFSGELKLAAMELQFEKNETSKDTCIYTEHQSFTWNGGNIKSFFTRVSNDEVGKDVVGIDYARGFFSKCNVYSFNAGFDYCRLVCQQKPGDNKASCFEMRFLEIEPISTPESWLLPELRKDHDGLKVFQLITRRKLINLAKKPVNADKRVVRVKNIGQPISTLLDNELSKDLQSYTIKGGFVFENNNIVPEGEWYRGDVLVSDKNYKFAVKENFEEIYIAGVQFRGTPDQLFLSGLYVDVCKKVDGEWILYLTAKKDYPYKLFLRFQFPTLTRSKVEVKVENLQPLPGVGNLIKADTSINQNDLAEILFEKEAKLNLIMGTDKSYKVKYTHISCETSEELFVNIKKSLIPYNLQGSYQVPSMLDDRKVVFEKLETEFAEKHDQTLM